MATYTTYNQVGQAEDVSKVISNIAPTETPFLTSIGTEKASARLFEWQEDDLAAPTTIDLVEGADFTDDTLSPTVMRSNYVQIFNKTFKVSRTADAIKTHGRAKETAYQLAKRGKEMKRDEEHTMIGIVQSAAVGDATSNSRLTGNVWGNDQAANPLIASAATLDNAAVPRALTEALTLTALQTMFNNGATPEIMMIKPADSLIVADFAYATQGGATTDTTKRHREVGSSQKIVNVVSVYVSPFGQVRMVLNRWIKSTEALIYQPKNWKKVVLRGYNREKLANTGDADRHAVTTEWGLKHANYLASLRITDLS